MQQIDVSTAYLNSDLLSDVYIRLPTEQGGDIWPKESLTWVQTGC
jgi:hypothetical protein